MNDALAKHRFGSGCHFLLVGSDDAASQGGPAEHRALQHASVAAVGDAYMLLRSVGVPRHRITTVVQLRDHLNVLERGASGEFRSANGLAPASYAAEYATVKGRCQCLLDEGGAHWDGRYVNASQVLAVLAGDGPSGRVVPHDGSCVNFAIYAKRGMHPLHGHLVGDACNQWFIHFPYPSEDPGTYDSIESSCLSMESANYYLHTAQIQRLLGQLFHVRSERPVVGLLNCHGARGNLAFMKEETAMQCTPLFLVASCWADSSLANELWKAWFAALVQCLNPGEASGKTLQMLQDEAENIFLETHRDELLHNIIALARPADIWALDFFVPGLHAGAVDPWYRDLERAVPQGQPDIDRLQELQRAYETGTAFRLVKGGGSHAAIKAGGAWAQLVESGRCIVWAGSHEAGELFFGDVPESLPYPVRLEAWQGPKSGSTVDLTSVAASATGQVVGLDIFCGEGSGVRDWPLDQVLGLICRSGSTSYAAVSAFKQDGDE